MTIQMYGMHTQIDAEKTNALKMAGRKYTQILRVVVFGQQDFKVFYILMNYEMNYKNNSSRISKNKTKQKNSTTKKVFSHDTM